jgi:hypothetical protein
MPRTTIPTATLLIAAFGVLSAAPAARAGAWVPAPREGYLQFGFSRKTGDVSWDAFGNDLVAPPRYEVHDFRYYYLSGEIGLAPRVSGTFLVTFLDGREGPRGDLHRNAGTSDAWFGLNVAAFRGEWPVSFSFTVRTDALYDLDGPYTLDLYDDQTEFVSNSPEWRGILKEDYTVATSVGHSFSRGRGWAQATFGYTWRTGAPADQLPVYAELGWTLPWRGIAVRASSNYVRSLGNDTPRQPDDRFGSRPGFNFNDASMWAVGGSFLIPIPRPVSSQIQVGYNVWVWGRSARQYQEPFLALTKLL